MQLAGKAESIGSKLRIFASMIQFLPVQESGTLIERGDEKSNAFLADILHLVGGLRVRVAGVVLPLVTCITVRIDSFLLGEVEVG